jgi:hypothetical protein
VDIDFLNIISQKLNEFDFPYPTASLYKDLCFDKKRSIDNILQTLNIDNPIVFYSLINGDWLVITSSKVVIQNDRLTKIIGFDEIIRIKSDRNERFNESKSSLALAFDLRNWIIVDKNNDEYLISIEKGKIWGSFFHLMQKILRHKGYWE